MRASDKFPTLPFSFSHFPRGTLLLLKKLDDRIEDSRHHHHLPPSLSPCPTQKEGIELNENELNRR